MNLADLNKVALAMVAPGKGVLAADESTGTIKKRFDAIGTENTEDNRRDYRELMFRTTEAMKNHISGVILYDETIWQKAKDGTPLVDIIKKAGALPGIKVDEGIKPLPNCPGEVVTIGLDKLADRLPKYYDQGARFAKWRAVIDVGPGIPSYDCIHANAHALARYAALCPEQGEFVAAFFARAAVQRLTQALGAFGRLAGLGHRRFADFIAPAATTLGEMAAACGLPALTALATRIREQEAARERRT